MREVDVALLIESAVQVYVLPPPQHLLLQEASSFPFDPHLLRPPPHHQLLNHQKNTPQFLVPQTSTHVQHSIQVVDHAVE